MSCAKNITEHLAVLTNTRYPILCNTTEIGEVYIQCKSCESEKSSAYKGSDTLPGSHTHFQKEHVKKVDTEQHFLSLIVTGVAL
jgi:hypothetical protein